MTDKVKGVRNIKMSIGLVLEGGGMRGLFTTGVLDFFLENDIEFKHIIGVSAGACHASSYISRQPGRSFAVSTDYLSDKHYCGLYSFITTGDLFGAEMIYDTIPNKLNPIDYKAAAENPAVFRVVVTNCRTGQAEYPIIEDMKRDTIYIRASSSLPIVSKPVKINNELYFDGGVADSIPLAQSIKFGMLKNVVVLTRERGYMKSPNKMMPYIRMKYRKYPELIKSIENRHIMYNNELKLIASEEKAGRAFVISPNQPLPCDRVEKDVEKLRICYRLGYNAAADSLEKLKAFLEK